MSAGGNNVDSERMSQLEREVTAISTDVKYIVKMMDNLATKAELSAIEGRVKRIEDDSKHKTATSIAALSALAAVGSLLYVVFHH